MAGQESISEIFARCGTIEQLDVDLQFAEHMADRGTYAKHDVSIGGILEVIDLAPAFFVNSAGRRAPIIMVGPTQAGRVIVVPVEPTDRWQVWRPVTAYEANAHHIASYNEEIK